MITNSEKYRLRKKQGICTDCGKAEPNAGFARCDACLEIRRNRWRQRIEKGICPKCGQPLANDKRTCDTCLIKFRNRRNELVQTRRAAGMCIFCGTTPVESPFTICEPCRIKKRKREGNRRLDGGSREEVFIRDGSCCRLCGGAHRLRVHHIDGTGNTDNANHKLENLISLCLPCHSHLHAVALFCKDLDLFLALVKQLQD